ncbi:MAG: OmpA family protein [Kofleriaceae bacterium]|nr:OmpA family protein [Kofleriaceae bacterium]
MRPSILLTLGLSLSLVSACGGDAKKKPTTQQAKLVESPGPVEETPEPEVSGGAVEPTSPSAELTPTLYFGHDQSELDDEARATLQANAEWMKEDSDRVLTIEGHTDESGTTGYNLALGERRARVTKAYLTRLGVEESRVQIITYGEERPASSSDSDNRRSVFVGTTK